MKKLFVIFTIPFLFSSCKSQQYSFNTLCGTYDGKEGFYYVELKLNQDSTCSLMKLFDLAQNNCYGEWYLHNNLITIKCNRNPESDDITKALQGGGFIEGNLELKVLSNKKLKLDDTILKRKN